MRYLLKDLATQKILAIDQTPNLLNYLRKVLPDCTLELTDQVSKILSFEQEQVDALQELCTLLEKYRLDYVMWLPIIDKPIQIANNENVIGFCNSLGLDFVQLKKENALIYENYELCIQKIVIFFDYFSKQILNAKTSEDLIATKATFNRQIIISQANS